jgi:hypothetical protein
VKQRVALKKLGKQINGNSDDISSDDENKYHC